MGALLLRSGRAILLAQLVANLGQHVQRLLVNSHLGFLLRILFFSRNGSSHIAKFVDGQNDAEVDGGNHNHKVQQLAQNRAEADGRAL